MTADKAAEALRRSIGLSSAEKVLYLLDQLGPRMTAAALGLSDARPLRRWLTGELDGWSPQAVAADRLRILYRITYLITEVDGAAAASGFIRSANPYLSDEAVLILLRDDDPTRHEQSIIAAMQAFIGD